MSSSRASHTFDKFVPEPERYEFRAGSIHRFELQRREFFKLLGAGVAVFAVASQARALQETTPAPAFHSEEIPSEISAWLHIGEDGKITALTGKVEVGQNIRTSLAQTVADELHVAFENVSMITGDTSIVPFDAGTFGSRTTATITPELRRMAAATRGLLLELAAKQWKLPVEQLAVHDGRVVDAAGHRSVSYADLARGKALAQKVASQAQTSPASDWEVAGRPIAKVGARDFVTGRHLYTPDLRPAGLQHGKVLRPPSMSATVTSCDLSEAQKMPGVTVFRDGDFIAAAAPTTTAAQDALDAVVVKWREIPQPDGKDLFTILKRNAPATVEDKYRKHAGSLSDAFASADQILNGTYTTAYIAHAPLEPRAAVAEWKGDQLTVSTGTQRPFSARDELAAAFHIPETNVRVIVPDTGSAYGGKHSGDAALEAARIAKAAAKPVKVVWTREEEFSWAYFRPAALIEVKSGINKDGKVIAWDFHNYNSGVSAIETPYAVANYQTAFHLVHSPLRQGSYRGLAATANIFARETHMDELAQLAKAEPLEFRMRNLLDPRLRAVLEAGAKAFAWPGKKVRSGQGFGVAAGNEKGGYVATFVEIMTNSNPREVRVVRVVNAYECGAIVNPDGLRNQVVGGVIQGLGGALFEEIEYGNGRIKNPHFSSYRLPRFRDIPAIEAVLIDRKDIPSAGAGETPLLGIAPAIGNAIFDATGIRLRSLPLVAKGLPS
jgi:nicotinate dehydrogenase subunit B